MTIVLFILLSSNFAQATLLCQSNENALATQIDELDESHFKQGCILDLSRMLAEKGDVQQAKLLLSKLQHHSQRRNAAVRIASVEAMEGRIDDAIATLRKSCEGSELKDRYEVELVNMMTSAGLYSQAMELAKDSSLKPPIACEAVIGSTEEAVRRLRLEELFSGRWEVIKIAAGFVRSRELQKATDLFRKYEPETQDINMAILAVSLADNGEFSRADEILAANLTGSYETATRYLVGAMRPYVSDFDWVARDIRRERFVVEALERRFRVGEWILIEHARLERARGFSSNAYKYCVEANKEIAQVSGEGRPQEPYSPSGETLRLRQALAMELAELDKLEDAIEIACQIRDRFHYDWFLKTLELIGASCRQQISFSDTDTSAKLLPDKIGRIAFQLGKFSGNRVVIGRWTQFDMGRSLLMLKNQAEKEIATGTVRSRDVLVAALSFEPPRLNDLMTLLIERKSADELCWLLWFSPPEYLPESCLKDCMTLNDPLLSLLAGSRLARGSAKGNINVIRRLVELSTTSDQELRYSVLSVLCEHSNSDLQISGLVVRESDDLEARILLSVIQSNTRISDETLANAIGCQNSWLLGLVSERVARQSRETTDNSAHLERIWHSGSPYGIIRAAAAIPHEGQMGESRNAALQLLLNSTLSDELEIRARKLLSN